MNKIKQIVRCHCQGDGSKKTSAKTGVSRNVVRELLYLHPYREGNGRTARLFASLIYLKQTGKSIDFSSILKERIEDYIKAVQQASRQEYDLMEDLFIDALK